MKKIFQKITLVAFLAFSFSCANEYLDIVPEGYPRWKTLSATEPMPKSFYTPATAICRVLETQHRHRDF